jgi:hypothetical protein
MRIPWQEAFHVVRLAETKGLTELAFQSLPGFEVFRSFCPPLLYARSGLAHLSNQYSVSILDGKPCSACTESFAKALPQIQKDRADPKDAVFVLGGSFGEPMHKQIGSGTAVFIGNCSFSAVASEMEALGFPDRVIELWRKSQKIPGCPPTIDDLKRLGGAKSRAHGVARVSEEILRAFEIDYFQLLQTKPLYHQILPLIPHNSVSFDMLGKEAMVAGELICAAICHQMNWEFLRRRVFEAISTGEEWWWPNRLHEVRSETVSKLLSGYHDEKRVKASQRANLLKSLAQAFRGEVSSYLDLVKARLATEGWSWVFAKPSGGTADGRWKHCSTIPIGGWKRTKPAAAKNATPPAPRRWTRSLER